MDPMKAQTIARLRESKTKYEAAEFESGKHAGTRWAECAASWEELERLSRQSWEGLSSGQDEDDWSWTLAHAIDLEAGSEAVNDLLVNCARDAMSEQFARGFLEGATDAFAEVRSEV